MNSYLYCLTIKALPEVGNVYRERANEVLRELEELDRRRKELDRSAERFYKEVVFSGHWSDDEIDEAMRSIG